MAKQNCSVCADGCGSCADEAAKIQQRIFEREVDEELRQERLMRWWQRYRFVVLGGVVGVILGTIGVEWYQAYRTKIRLAESDVYENAVVMAAEGKTTEAEVALRSLSETAKTDYRFLAQLQVAGLNLKADKKPEALQVLRALADDEKAPMALRRVALLAFVGHQVDDGDVAALQAALAPVLADTHDAFYGEAAELSALLALKAGQSQQAKAIINTALAQQNVGAALRERLTLLKNGI